MMVLLMIDFKDSDSQILLEKPINTLVALN